MIVKSVYHWGTASDTKVTPQSPSGAVVSSKQADRTLTVYNGVATASFDPRLKTSNAAAVYRDSNEIIRERNADAADVYYRFGGSGNVIWQSDSKTSSGTSRSTAYVAHSTISSATSSSFSSLSSSGTFRFDSASCLPCSRR